ncbi:ABC transporter ATP-binding protein [Schleiferilactobacillus harbinensis]|nr:ABC transporter ATP-binding protein [Schleiferilactobacillus harbinensis]HAY54179.1 ABC transporter ATP-binding protein [Lactobacillus sp.]MBO3092079.1 ABC transporter ATP-binding protein [Schleiferilactobacillus harbinensis]MCI1688481.1 ABC transporter ATP-binding protein [Schleiferilactobacillus harbinensis]MCI1784400.1 ABC transporter ATP-binding protein [Schleiferilactobacillus harbinensis]MCI1851820.1 ABC transporter ATP-binding protein [Schleiferilactobacillus harbinensis]
MVTGEEENLIVVDGLAKQYKEFTLHGIHFHLPAGYIMGMIGPNGAGKTTTIKALLDMIRPDAGTISLLGAATAADRIALRDSLGVQLDTTLYPDYWRVKQVAKSLRSFFPQWDDAYFDQLCTDMEIPLKTKYKSMSRGTQVKLQLAAALAHHPRLLILDEPTAGLDPLARDELLTRLQDFIADGQHSVLLSTHLTGDLERIADFLLYIRGGRQQFFGHVDDLLGQYVLIKGGLADLTPALRAALIGLRTHSEGFSGLLAVDQTVGLPDTLLQESITLEELMIYFGRGPHA